MPIDYSKWDNLADSSDESVSRFLEVTNNIENSMFFKFELDRNQNRFQQRGPTDILESRFLSAPAARAAPPRGGHGFSGDLGGGARVEKSGLKPWSICNA